MSLIQSNVTDKMLRDGVPSITEGAILGNVAIALLIALFYCGIRFYLFYFPMYSFQVGEFH